MWKKHQHVFDDHISYVINDITKPFKMMILKYAASTCKIFELAHYLSPLRNRGEGFDGDDWKTHDINFFEEGIFKSITHGLPNKTED